ncbi:MAG: aminopeptidase [Ekhidna sp.]
MIKKAAWLILSLILVLIIINWDVMIYGLKQAKGQLSITFNTRPVELILEDSLIADSLKQKIQLVHEAREFAFNELGLKQSDNYTTFYDQKGEVALWNLSASKQFALEPKLWSFPLLGSFPYKGFFDLANAKEEMQDLKLAGYDARIRSVGGWSTLGWTTDPILSNMLDRQEGALAELIIHELTHSTLFVKDNIEFNENLASFIGEEGTIMFLNEKYGKNSYPYFDYVLAEEDSRTFRNQMLSATLKLDSLYASILEFPDSIKTIQKHIMIDEIVSSIDTLHFHDARYSNIFRSGRPNNAYFMSYLRYYSAKDSLQSLLKNEYQNNLALFIRGMKEFHN